MLKAVFSLLKFSSSYFKGRKNKLCLFLFIFFIYIVSCFQLTRTQLIWWHLIPCSCQFFLRLMFPCQFFFTFFTPWGYYHHDHFRKIFFDTSNKGFWMFYLKSFSGSFLICFFVSQLGFVSLGTVILLIYFVKFFFAFVK